MGNSAGSAPGVTAGGAARRAVRTAALRSDAAPRAAPRASAPRRSWDADTDASKLLEDVNCLWCYIQIPPRPSPCFLCPHEFFPTLSCTTEKNKKQSVCISHPNLNKTAQRKGENCPLLTAITACARYTHLFFLSS